MKTILWTYKKVRAKPYLGTSRRRILEAHEDQPGEDRSLEHSEVLKQQ